MKALYADEKSPCCSLPRSGESEASLPFVSELRCEDMYMSCTESEELCEYADSRLEIEDLRLSFTGSMASGSSWVGTDGGDFVEAAAGGGDPTAFLGSGGIFFCNSSGDDTSPGRAGSGESMGFGTNRAPTESFLGGRAIVVAMLGRPGSLRGILKAGEVVEVGVAAVVVVVEGGEETTDTAASFCRGGGTGSAFEKRERPPVLGGSSVAVFHSMMNYQPDTFKWKEKIQDRDQVPV